jgi:hypothetical protein
MGLLDRGDRHPLDLLRQCEGWIAAHVDLAGEAGRASANRLLDAIHETTSASGQATRILQVVERVVLAVGADGSTVCWTDFFHGLSDLTGIKFDPVLLPPTLFKQNCDSFCAHLYANERFKRAAADPQGIANLLNSLLAVDPAACGRLIAARVPCNDLVAEHPSIVVEDGKDGEGRTSPVVGVLGVLNGLVWHTGKVVAAVYSDDAVPTLTGFAVVRPKVKGGTGG